MASGCVGECGGGGLIQDRKANRVPLVPGTAMVTDGVDESGDNNDDDDSPEPSQQKSAHMLGDMEI